MRLRGIGEDFGAQLQKARYDGETMNPELFSAQSIRPLVFKVVAWVFWTVFLLASICLFAFATAVRNDVYFDRYYGHHPMSRLTVVMTMFPVWMILIPFLWLPFIIAYQRQNTPRGILLLPLIVSMFMAALVVFVLILCSGPPVQM